MVERPRDLSTNLSLVKQVLEDEKRLVLKNLWILEVMGYMSSKDGCQSIITDLAKDILNQRDHRYTIGDKSS